METSSLLSVDPNTIMVRGQYEAKSLFTHSIRTRFAGRLNSRVMPHKIMHRTLLILTIASCAGCVNYADTISEQFEASGKKFIDLKAAVPSDWDRVCFVGPYQDEAFVEKTLGFSWPAERKTSIEDNDGITVLLFVKDRSVLAHVEHPRDHGDFNELEGQCFSPEDATFRSFPSGPANWPLMVPE